MQKIEIVEATPIVPKETTKGGFKLGLNIIAKDQEGNITGKYCNAGDISVQAFAYFIQSNLFNTAESITDTSGTARAITANSAATVPLIYAGTGTTAAAFTDHVLTTPTSGTSGYADATINSLNTTSKTFTVTATITNSSGSSITYSEVGIGITSATYVFLLSHDVFTGLAVTNGGSLLVTYTLTFG